MVIEAPAVNGTNSTKVTIYDDPIFDEYENLVVTTEVYSPDAASNENMEALTAISKNGTIMER